MTIKSKVGGYLSDSTRTVKVGENGLKTDYLWAVYLIAVIAAKPKVKYKLPLGCFVSKPDVINHKTFTEKFATAVLINRTTNLWHCKSCIFENLSHMM